MYKSAKLIESVTDIARMLNNLQKQCFDINPCLNFVNSIFVVVVMDENTYGLIYGLHSGVFPTAITGFLRAFQNWKKKNVAAPFISDRSCF